MRAGGKLYVSSSEDTISTMGSWAIPRHTTILRSSEEDYVQMVEPKKPRKEWELETVSVNGRKTPPTQAKDGKEF